MLRDHPGGAAIEFALIAPVLTTLIFAAAEFGIYLVPGGRQKSGN